MLSQKIIPAPRFLVIGGNGLLGGELSRRWRASGQEVIATNRQTLDLTGAVEQWNPPPGGGVAMICAAVADQERCRREPEATRRCNVQQTLKLARRLVDCDYFVVFLSTSLVFDGAKLFPATEDPVCPATEYGRQKADAESGLQALAGGHAIVRLTKVIHEKLPLLLKWREALARGEAIRPFRNYICAPISLDFAVSGIAAVAEAGKAGVWHFSARDNMAYSEMAQLFARQYGYADSLVAPADAPPGLLEHLPRHATLDGARAEKEFGLKMPWAREALACFEFANGAPPVKP